MAMPIPAQRKGSEQEREGEQRDALVPRDGAVALDDRLHEIEGVQLDTIAR
jgi:hypothetical protein